MSRGRLGEYPADPRFAIATKLANNRNIGPVRSPIIPGPNDQPPDTSWMAQLINTYAAMSIMRPHEIQYFSQPSQQVNLVAAAAPVLVTQFQMPENQDGFLQEIWLDVNPPGTWVNTQWSIKVDGSIHPQFNSVFWPAIDQWSKFEISLNRGQTVALFANSSVGTNVAAIVSGWGRLIPDGIAE